MNVRAIVHLREAFGVAVGLSDHTLTNVAAMAAVAMGAVIVEKHLTLDRSAGGPDAAFSLEPREFAALVADIRETEKVLGSETLAPVPEETQNIAFRRSLFVVQDIEQGQPLTAVNVRSIRPGHGLAPRHLKEVIGRTVTRRVSRGTPLTWDLVDG
jgi:sialic acid synthase SpsE